jgi:hypothetical protein
MLRLPMRPTDRPDKPRGDIDMASEAHHDVAMR